MFPFDEKADILTTQERQQVGRVNSWQGVMGLKLLMAKGRGQTQTISKCQRITFTQGFFKPI